MLWPERGWSARIAAPNGSAVVSNAWRTVCGSRSGRYPVFRHRPPPWDPTYNLDEAVAHPFRPGPSGKPFRGSCAGRQGLIGAAPSAVICVPMPGSSQVPDAPAPPAPGSRWGRLRRWAANSAARSARSAGARQVRLSRTMRLAHVQANGLQRQSGAASVPGQSAAMAGSCQGARSSDQQDTAELDRAILQGMDGRRGQGALGGVADGPQGAERQAVAACHQGHRAAFQVHAGGTGLVTTAPPSGPRWPRWSCGRPGCGPGGCRAGSGWRGRTCAVHHHLGCGHQGAPGFRAGSRPPATPKLISAVAPAPDQVLGCASGRRHRCRRRWRRCPHLADQQGSPGPGPPRCQASWYRPGSGRQARSGLCPEPHWGPQTRVPPAGPGQSPRLACLQRPEFRTHGRRAGRSPRIRLTKRLTAISGKELLVAVVAQVEHAREPHGGVGGFVPRAIRLSGYRASQATPRATSGVFYLCRRPSGPAAPRRSGWG